MKVLVAGATGVVGRQLVPLLRAVGHEVIGLARTRRRAQADMELLAVDALDRVALTGAVRRTAPDAVVNLLTAIPDDLDPRRFGQQMVMTNRLRSEGTANLIAAAPDARLITEGLAFAYEPSNRTPAAENRPLWEDGPKPFRPVVKALLAAERSTRAAGGTVLRLGHLYGPGTVFADDGALVALLRAGKVPVVGRGESVFSFTHTHDAATAIVAALDVRTSGVFNIVDDEPAPVHEWLPELARLTGARQPRRVPRAAARLLAGSWGVAFMTSLVGADNRRARHALDWRPAYATWREGFTHEHESRRPRIIG